MEPIREGFNLELNRYTKQNRKTCSPTIVCTVSSSLNFSRRDYDEGHIEQKKPLNPFIKWKSKQEVIEV